MSVFQIYIKEGTKHMRPITTREEYIRLRDSEQNRRAEKKSMVQMAYSCLPNEDGTLRGSKRVSTTIGADIDMEVDVQKVLERKEELGLLMLEQSATKGYHIVFRRHEEMSNEANLRWIAEQIGVEYDKGAKDITRVFYTPADKLLYLDDAIFEVKEAATAGTLELRNLETKEPETLELRNPETLELRNLETKELPETAAGMKPEPATAENLIKFDLCVKQAGLESEKMDVWGDHNWHTNLMSVLSVGLPKLMSKEQLIAVVAERLPNYSKSADCMALINYFYEKYTADKGFMNTSLREINAKAQSEALQNTVKADTEEEQLMEELEQGWNPPKLPKRLPRIMELLTENYDPRYKEMLVLASLPVLSAHASHFKARYLSGKVLGCQQYVAVIGASGSGKGNCTELYKEMVQYTLQQNDTMEWEKVRQNTELRDKKANAKDRPPKYHPRLRLFETTSKSSILELQTNLGKNGMLLGQFSEADGLSASSRAAHSDLSVLLRKGWDGDMHRQFYMNSENTCNTYTNMNISLLMAGTVKAMLERLFNDSNCEGGLMQRFISVLVPKMKRTFRPPKINYLNDEEKKERDELLISLYEKDLALGDDTSLLELPLTNKAVGEWFDSLEERYNDGELTEAEADLSHRCGEFMLRAAIPLVALYGEETKEIVDLCRWVGEYAHYSMCYIFGKRVQTNLKTAEELLAESQDRRCTAEPILNQLPEVFSLKEMQALREKNGQSSDSRALLTRYCRNGKIERVGRGIYRKRMLHVSETKKGNNNMKH